MTHLATPPPTPRLETPRLVLRTLAPSDADDIFAYAADPAVAQYTLWHAHTTLEDSRRFITWIIGGSLACWAIVQPITSRVIGSIFLHSHHVRYHRAEIAFNLAQHAWGRGYATEAAHAVIQAGFTQYGLNRIEGTCMLDNVASARVMEKVGMRCEGTLRLQIGGFTVTNRWTEALITRASFYLSCIYCTSYSARNQHRPDFPATSGVDSLAEDALDFDAPSTLPEQDVLLLLLFHSMF